MNETKMSYLNKMNTLKFGEEWLESEKEYTLEEVYHHLANIDSRAIFCHGLDQMFNNFFGTPYLSPFIRNVQWGYGISYNDDAHFRPSANGWKLMNKKLPDTLDEDTPILDCNTLKITTEKENKERRGKDTMKNLFSIKNIMNLVRCTIGKRKIYKYDICMDIQTYNEREGSFYPGENSHCFGDLIPVTVTLYSFYKFKSSTIDRLAARYSGMILPYNVKEVADTIVLQNPQFFTMDIEECPCVRIHKNIYL